MSSRAIEIAARIRKMEEEAKVERQAVFGDFLVTVFADFPDVNRVVIKGYTPGFNDGDPCEHSHETYLTPRAFGELFDGESDEFEDTFEYVSGEGYVLNTDVDGTLFNARLTDDDANDLYKAFGAFDNAIHDIFGTDFVLTWVRDAEALNGGVTFSREDYCCGW